MKKLRFYIRIISFLLIMAMMAALTGCKNESKIKEPVRELTVVGFSQVGSESSWRVANSESMKAEFTEKNGYELIFDDAKQKQENQYKAIRTFIQQKVDYIVLAPITETGWDDVLLEAKQAGIPVIVVDRRVEADESLYTSWVGSDFLGEGKTAMKWLEKELEDRGRADDEISILHLQGTPGATAQIMRTRGLEEALEAHENWSLAALLEGEYTEAKAYEVTTEFLKSCNLEHVNAQSTDDADTPETEAPSDTVHTPAPFDAVYCENDNMAFGVMHALSDFGISYGRDGDVIIISFDAVRSALEECLAGNINLCVECNPLHGPRVARIIETLESGVIPVKDVYVEETSFDTETLTQEIIDARVY